MVGQRQLRDLGRSPDSIKRLHAAGYLHRVHRGVYAVGHTALSPDARRMAASLAVRGGSPVVRYSAGEHLALTRRRAEHGMVEVGVATHSAAHRADIRVLRLSTLAPRHLVVERGVLCSSVSRTLVDLAGVLSGHDLAVAVREAEFRRVLDRDAIRVVLADCGRPPGARALRSLLDLPADGLPDSLLERRFLELVTAAGLLPPRLQQRFVIGDPPEQIRVDFYWPAVRLVVEVDGPHHELPAFRKRDAERDAGLRALGLTVVRIAAAALRTDPAGVVASVARLIANVRP